MRHSHHRHHPRLTRLRVATVVDRTRRLAQTGACAQSQLLHSRCMNTSHNKLEQQTLAAREHIANTFSGPFCAEGAVIFLLDSEGLVTIISRFTDVLLFCRLRHQCDRASQWNRSTSHTNQEFVKTDATDTVRFYECVKIANDDQHRGNALGRKGFESTIGDGATRCLHREAAAFCCCL